MPKAFVPLTQFVNESKSIPREHPLDKPVAKWIEEEVLGEEVVEAGVAILRTRGCYWSIKEGCSMCGYFNDTVPGGVSTDMLHSQWKKIRHSLKGKRYAKIYTSGSFLDPTEVPLDFANDVMSDMADMGIEKVLVESLPEFVHPKHFSYSNSPKIEIAIGLESSNSVASSIASLSPRYGGFSSTYALTSAPFSWAVSQTLTKCGHRNLLFTDLSRTVQSAIDAAPYVDKISINPVNVQKNTVVEKLWFRNEWTAPWLWSVVEVLERCKDLPAKVYSDPTGGGTRRGAHNCNDCNGKILEALKEHRLGTGNLKGLECECRPRWEVLKHQSSYRRNGAEPHGYRRGFGNGRRF
uniref:Putative Fe-S oxidoreductase n=1 Tax=uncultured marine group II/III euryarchaeote KM3_203_F09 TaxID=1456423 RepID=A0A075GUW3_9EURY|nr:putative Fe-S oxidoreductase [uncultured marine group II/III euryarchaeote KM3_203_F09]